MSKLEKLRKRAQAIKKRAEERRKCITQPPSRLSLEEHNRFMKELAEIDSKESRLDFFEEDEEEKDVSK